MLLQHARRPGGGAARAGRPDARRHGRRSWLPVDLRVQLLRKRLAGTRRPRHGCRGRGAADGGAPGARAAARLLVALEPPRLGEGLVGALRDLAAGIFQGTRVAFEVVVESEEQIPEPTARVLYRIAAEALSNVVRHADAQFVVIRLADESFSWRSRSSTTATAPAPTGSPSARATAVWSGCASASRTPAARSHCTATPAAAPSFRRGSRRVPARCSPTYRRWTCASRCARSSTSPRRRSSPSTATGTTSSCNRRAADLADRTARELEGRNIWTEFPQAVRSTFYVQCMRAMAEQRSAEFADFTGGRWMENRLLPTPQGLFAFYRDVTGAAPLVATARPIGRRRALLLAAVVKGATEDDPVRAVQRILQTIVESRWFSAARVFRPTDDLRGGAAAGDGTAPAAPDGHRLARALRAAAGLDRGRVEFERRVPVHLAVRWLARVVAALVTPAVQAGG